ncbi:MAG TPA: SGNH/GDSL hydrolase family protein [Candidatus Udaeobacter sp.]|nr:SGNH/GDSL hydrolase family protein [Candidatus Udaeobacter sp.]
MKSARRFVLFAAAAVALIAGCSKITALVAPGLKSGSADFSVYVAMGTSISAGFESGGLVVTHQQRSFPWLFAHQVHAQSFTIPSISPDGIPPLLQIISLSPLIVSNAGRVLGAPTNLAQPSAYHDMGIPGAVVFDVADSSAYHSSPNPVGRTDFTFFNLIQRSRGTILQQVLSLSPTFISFEYGANEALGPALAGGTIPVLPAGTFAALLHGTLDGLQAFTTAKFAIINVPDATTIPFVTTFPPAGALDATGNVILVSGYPVPLIGNETGSPAPLGFGDYVLLSAAESLAVGTGFPVGTYSYLTGAPGNGRPLPNSMVLSSTEAAAISSTVNAYNNAIASEAAARGLALVDFHALLAEAATTGIRFQGTAYTNAYITGGLFGLDGVHPNDLGQGLIANVMIASVNRTFGSNIPPVNLSAAATLSSSRAKPAGKGRALPWLEHGEAFVEQLFGRPPAL